jgi:DNA mismatch repair ATPase MutS
MGFRPVARVLLWADQNAIAIERWRGRYGGQVRRWLAAVGELEALSSLAGYAAEHPDDVFPALLDDGPLFDGEGVAHPLIARPAAVRNDVRLDSECRLLVVSGSNMSGKSTLLRAVGLNTVLAWAGAPVCARRLQVSRLAVGAVMRAQDSVLEGRSRFYAEITRVRQVVDMASGSVPLLFLLDEMLSGTNSHDRRIGAEAILRTLVGRGTLGLITTHDLALAEIADALAPHAANVHFEDHIENGHIAFDYRMRPGVVTRSNALELMRSVGLDV